MGWHVLRLATLLCKQRVVGSILTVRAITMKSRDKYHGTFFCHQLS